MIFLAINGVLVAEGGGGGGGQVLNVWNTSELVLQGWWVPFSLL